MRSFKIYDFTLSAGGAMPLLVEGGYFKIYSCTGVLAVSIDGGSTIGPINTGQGMKTEFKRLTIVDQSGAANVGKIIVASNEFVDDRISGEVSVIDGGKARTLSSIAFTAYSGINAVAGQYSHCQVWNPTITKNLIVEQLIVTSTVAQSVILRAHNAALATGYTQLNPSSKKIGGADGTMENRITTNAAQLPTGKLLGSFNLPVAGNFAYKLTEPIIIPPSQGLVAFSGVVNTDLTITVECFEEPI